MTRRHEGPVAEPVRFIDERLGAARGLRYLMNYIFPDHWSFMLGEIALYAFVVLVATGTFLALYFSPNTDVTVYHGTYAPLQGLEVSEAYNSALRLSFAVSGGLLMRQTHHWAALVFVAAITLHLLRIIFTGAFRKPRELNYIVGVTMLGMALLEGFCGYSLPDDLLSGMGLAIAWSVAMSIPLVGGPVATAIWAGVYPGKTDFESRLFIVHVFVLPLLLATLIGAHLVMIMRQHHTQFRGPGRRERNVVGTPMWPGYALRSLGLFMLVFAVLLLMGGLIQINPVWLWGPYHVYVGSNGAQPDWYLGWLIGALRLMPNLEISVGGHTLVPNPFWGGVFFPTVVFLTLYAFPWIDRRFFTRDRLQHHLLDRPRDNPARSAFAAGFTAAIVIVFLAGSADRLFFQFGYEYQGAVLFFQVVFLAVPPVVCAITYLVCRELRRSGAHPMRGWSGALVRRTESGGLEPLADAGVEDGPEQAA